MLIKDTAICIRAIDYSETSQIVTFFTRATGKISAIAKGSKRPKSAFDGPIEIFAHGKIVFSDSNKEKLATLTEFSSGRLTAEQQPLQYAIRDTRYDISLFAMNCQLFAAELLNSLTHDYDPHPDLFDSFLQFLQNTSENPPQGVQRRTSKFCHSEAKPKNLTHSQTRSFASAQDDEESIRQKASCGEYRDILSFLILFQLALLKEVGLQPILNACANCKTTYDIRHTTYEVYFSSSANGLICRDCEASFPDKIRLTKNAANCLASVKLIAESQEETLNEIEKVLISHFTELLGKPPKMAKHILKI